MSADVFFSGSVILIIFVFLYSLHLTHIVNARSLPNSLGKTCILNTHSSGRLVLFSDLLLCKLYKIRRRCTLPYGSSILLLEHLHFCCFCSSHTFLFCLPSLPALYSCAYDSQHKSFTKKEMDCTSS